MRLTFRPLIFTCLMLLGCVKVHELKNVAQLAGGGGAANATRPGR